MRCFDCVQPARATIAGATRCPSDKVIHDMAHNAAELLAQVVDAYKTCDSFECQVDLYADTDASEFDAVSNIHRIVRVAFRRTTGLLCLRGSVGAAGEVIVNRRLLVRPDSSGAYVQFEGTDVAPGYERTRYTRHVVGPDSTLSDLLLCEDVRHLSPQAFPFYQLSGESMVDNENHVSLDASFEGIQYSLLIRESDHTIRRTVQQLRAPVVARSEYTAAQFKCDIPEAYFTLAHLKKLALSDFVDAS